MKNTCSEPSKIQFSPKADIKGLLFHFYRASFLTGRVNFIYPLAKSDLDFVQKVRKDQFRVLTFTQMLSNQTRTVMILNHVMTMAFITSRCFFTVELSPS